MRRKAYLSRIVADATTKAHQPVLAPPRLLFRPDSTQFDVGMDGELQAGRPADSRGTHSYGAYQYGAYPPTGDLQPDGSWPSGSRAEGSRAAGSQSAGLRTFDSDLSAFGHSDGNPQPWTRSDMRNHSTDGAPRNMDSVTALRQSALQPHSGALGQGDSAASDALSGKSGHSGSNTANQAASLSHHQDLEPTAASLEMRSRNASTRKAGAGADEGQTGERGEGSRDGPGDDFASGLWRQVTSERASSNRRSAKAEVTPRPDLRPREPRREAHAARNDDSGGRVRIGTLELRILPAPNTPREISTAPAPARRSATAAPAARPLSRGFGVFGLSQS